MNLVILFFKPKTAYEMRISDWSSDVCSSDLIAGFGQIEAQVIEPGMVAEATCSAKPMTIIPMVVTEVQDVIASGQIRIGEQLKIGRAPCRDRVCQYV